MNLSIVIPTHGRSKKLKALLSSIDAQILNSNIQGEVIVASNFYNPKDRDLVGEHIKNFPVKYSWSGVRGANAARNEGIKKSKGDVVVFVDDDCLLNDENYLQKVYSLHLENPQVDVFGGRYLSPEKGQGVSAEAYQLNCDLWLDENKFEEVKIPNLVGGNLSLKKRVFEQQYKFSEEIVFGGTETELIHRMFKGGLKIEFTESFPVVHNPQMSIWGLMKKAFAQGRGRKFHGSFESPFMALARQNNKMKRLRNYSPAYQLIYSFALFIYAYCYELGYLKSHLYPEKSTSPWMFLKLVWLKSSTKEDSFENEGEGLFEPYHLQSTPMWNWNVIKHKYLANKWKVTSVVMKPFHWIKMRTWRVVWVAMWPLRNVISPSYWHYVHPILQRIRSNLWRFSWMLARPYHWTKPYFWKFLHPMFHQLKRVIWVFPWLALAPFRYIKMCFWEKVNPFVHRLFNIPRHFLSLHGWKLKHFPYHYAQLHSWKLQVYSSRIWFCAKSLAFKLSFPLRKVFYVFEYQLSKISYFRTLFGKYESKQFKAKA